MTSPRPAADMSGLVKMALARKLAGDSASYMRIVNEVMSGNAETLSKVFVGLTPCVTTLAKAPHEFKELVNAIFGVSTSVWAVLADVSSVTSTNKDAAASPGPVREALCDAFAEFVAQLVSANACFLLPALQALIRCFRTIDCVSISVLDSSVKAEHDPAAFVYTTLRCMLRLVPNGISSLFRVLGEHFPPKRSPATEHRTYVRHLLRVSEDIPPLRDRIFAIIVDKMIQIDVEIKLEDVPDDDTESTPYATPRVPNMHDISSPPATPTATPQPVALGDSTDAVRTPAVISKRASSDSRVQATGEMADKLDVLMVEVFEYMAFVHNRLQTAPVDQRDHMFHVALGVFERSILSTHKSKYTQFLLFFICKLHPSYPDLFVGRLVNLSRDSANAVLLRQSAAAYLGSFLSRAAFLKDTTLRSALVYCIDWVTQYAEDYASTMHAPAVLASHAASEMFVSSTTSNSHANDHSTFFSICQAVFYTVCFHAGAFQAKAGGIAFLAKFNWVTIVQSPLRPLRFCLGSVALEFLRVCSVLQLVPASTMVDIRKDMAHTPSAAAAGGSLEVASDHNPLDSFFPFDPYLLRQSSRFITGLYRQWVAAPDDADYDSTSTHRALMTSEADTGIGDDEDGEEDDDEDDEEDYGEDAVVSDSSSSASSDSDSSSSSASGDDGSSESPCSDSDEASSSLVSGEQIDAEPPLKRRKPLVASFQSAPSPAVSPGKFMAPPLPRRAESLASSAMRDAMQGSSRLGHRLRSLSFEDSDCVAALVRSGYASPFMSPQSTPTLDDSTPLTLPPAQDEFERMLLAAAMFS